MGALFHRFIRFAAALGVAVAVTAMSSTIHQQAFASTCSNLEAQLASLRSNPSRSRASRYIKAVKTQRQQIGKVDKTMSRLGCRIQKSFFKRSAHPRCDSLRNARRKMVRNLKGLERKAQKLSRGHRQSAVQNRRNRLLRAMKRKQCNTRTASVSHVSRAVAKIESRSRKLRAKHQSKLDKHKASRVRGTYRTLCVRTCDGYFFPASFSTTTASFGKDETACNSLCPGTKMKLYYHKAQDDGVDHMISARDGSPYASLPTAFDFRKKFNPSCGCKFKQAQRPSSAFNTSAQSSQRPSIGLNWTANRAKAAYAVPKFRKRALATDETYQVAEAQLRASIPSKAVRIGMLRKAPKVRIIGERFFPVR